MRSVPISPAIDRKSTRLNSSHTVIYTLSLHDALPISTGLILRSSDYGATWTTNFQATNEVYYAISSDFAGNRSEEHTSELQSHSDLHSFPTRRSSDLNWTYPEEQRLRGDLDHEFPGHERSLLCDQFRFRRQ